MDPESVSDAWTSLVGSEFSHNSIQVSQIVTDLLVGCQACSLSVPFPTLHFGMYHTLHAMLIYTRLLTFHISSLTVVSDVRIPHKLVGHPTFPLQITIMMKDRHHRVLIPLQTHQ